MVDYYGVYSEIVFFDNCFIYSKSRSSVHFMVLKTTKVRYQESANIPITKSPSPPSTPQK